MPLAIETSFTVEQDIQRREISLARQSMVASVRWGWFRDIGWSPHLHQVWAHDSDARYRLTCAGRRGGKTEWAAKEMGAYMVSGPFRCWIVAPSYELGWKEFRVVVEDLNHPAMPYHIARQYDSIKGGNLYISLSNGAECQVISIDKPRKSAHGEEVDLIILSETALMDNLAGEDGVWNKTLVGAMATRLAEVIIPTTPQGEDDFLYPMFMKGLVPNSPYSKYDLGGKEIDLCKYYKSNVDHDPDYFSLQWGAWLNEAGYLEDVAKQYNDLPYRIFMEQVAGFFVKWSGSIWLNDFCYDPAVCVIAPFITPYWWRRIEVIDPGFSGLFAWLAALVDESGNVFIVDEYSAQRTLYKDHVDEILRRRREYAAKNNHPSKIETENYIPVYVDPEDPQCLAELNALGLTCTSANNDVIAGFQSGAFRFKNGTLKLFSTLEKIDRALRNHEWMRQKAEGAKAKEANDVWKHWSDIVRYLNLAAIWAAERPKTISDVETIGDIINAYRKSDTSYLDMDNDQWERLHAAG